MATITAAGIGSGLDVNNILEQIVEAERAPAESRLDLKETNLQAELSAFGSFKSSVSLFQTSLGKLQSAALFNSSDVSVSNTDVLTASTSSISKPGNFSVEVKSLAQAQTLASIAFNELDDVIGSGTLTFDFGTTVYDPGTDYATGDDTYTSFTKNSERPSESIVIDNTNNTISGIRDAINAADIGVSATIVDDGSGFRLLLASDQQGLDNSLQVNVSEGGTVADDTDMSGLSVLAFNSIASNAEQTQSALDANISVNGLSVLRESNSIVGAIPGVTLNLKTADVGNPVQLVITSNNVEKSQENIGDFVDAFNELATVYNNLSAFGGNDGQNGILLGDNTSRNIIQQMRRELGDFSSNGGSFNSLSSIGITTARDGTLKLDAAVLNKALENDFDSVTQLFYASGNTTDSDVTFNSSTASTKAGDYSISVGSLATQGQLVAQGISGPITINATNDSFSLFVDGASTGNIAITQASYSDLNSLAQEIETRVNASSALQNISLNISVSYVSGALQFTSSSYGVNSSVSTSLQNSTLGLTSAATSSAGSDVTGSIGGLSAIGEGRVLTGSGEASGLAVEIAGSTAGSRGRTDSINKQILDISEQRVDLDARVAQIEERFRRQFSSLDVLISQLNATSSFLQQQLDSLPGISFNRK